MLCPLCGATVTYQGFNSLECVGVGCENYRKPPETLDEWKAVFDEAPIDWPWLCGFCAWAQNKLGTKVIPCRHGVSIWVSLPQRAVGFVVPPDATRQSLYCDMCQFEMFQALRGL